MTTTSASINYTSLIFRALRINGIPCTRKRLAEETLFQFTTKSDSVSSLEVSLSVRENGICRLSAFTPHQLPEGKTAAALTAFNALHNKYRFVNFRMDTDGAICARYDFYICPADTFPEALRQIIGSFQFVFDQGVEAITTALREADRQPEPGTEFEFFRINLFEED